MCQPCTEGLDENIADEILLLNLQIDVEKWQYAL